MFIQVVVAEEELSVYDPNDATFIMFSSDVKLKGYDESKIVGLTSF